MGHCPKIVKKSPGVLNYEFCGKIPKNLLAVSLLNEEPHKLLCGLGSDRIRRNALV